MIFDEIADEIGRAFEAFEAALFDAICPVPARLPVEWPEFNRYCWAKYGTGRTQPDE